MHRLRKRLQNLWNRKQLDRDLEDELAFHASMQGSASGMSAVKSNCRDQWTFTAIEGALQDIRYALRTLARNPSITLVALLALGLGIGVNTAVYTIIGKALQFDFGVENIERIVTVSLNESGDRNISLQPLLNFRDLLPQVKSIQTLAAYSYAQVNVSDRSALPERLRSVEMSAGGFAVMGRRPFLGRTIQPSDERAGATPVMILGYHLWQNRYGRDASILGRVLRVDEVPRVVVGVMPPDMRFPEDTDLWIPLSLETSQSRGNLLIFGRLAGNVKLSEARAELDTIARRLSEKAPQGKGLVAAVNPILVMYGVYDSRYMFLAVLAAVGFVLLIACADVANLLLARAASRGREISVRIAIGAGRLRILRQLLMESVVLALGGGFLGWMVAALLLHWFDARTARFTRPPWLDFSMHVSVFVYLAAVSLGTGILFGLVPALRLSKVDVNNAIKDGGHAAAGSVRTRKLANSLVVFEMTLCVALMTCAGLLIRSSLNLYSAPIGVNASNILTMQISLPEAKYPRSQDEISFHQRLKSRLEALPGVQSASLTSNLPGGGFMNQPFQLEGQDSAGPKHSPRTGVLSVDPDYFRVVEAQARRGRIFETPDTVAVNEMFASVYWPGEDPIGKRVKLARWFTVSALVPNIHQNPRRPMQEDPLVYIPYSDSPQRSVFILARTGVPTSTLIDPFRREVQALDENLPAIDVRSLDDRLDQNRLNVTSVGALFTVFGVIALVLASVGLYGVMSHSVSQRTREIGVRMALGGAKNDILRLVFTQGMLQIGAGLALGLPLAFAMSRILRGTLVGVSPGDPVTFASVTAVLALFGVLGCAIPAYRAVQVDPIVALRCD